MRIEEVVLSADRKHNLGNYENVGFFASIKVRCDSTETIETVAHTIGEQFPVILEDLKRQYDAYAQKRHQQLKHQADQLLKEAKQENPHRYGRGPEEGEA